MATEQSERIRAALLRAKASRQSSNSPTLESTDEPETTRTLKDFSETSESAVLETESISTESSLAELTEKSESETPLDEPFEDVETTLPLVAASEEFHRNVIDDGWLIAPLAGDNMAGAAGIGGDVVMFRTWENVLVPKEFFAFTLQ